VEESGFVELVVAARAPSLVRVTVPTVSQSAGGRAHVEPGAHVVVTLGSSLDRMRSSVTGLPLMLHATLDPLDREKTSS